MQSNLLKKGCHAPNAEKLHVAVIMDGNGRWAQKRQLPRHAGHAAGVRTVRDIVRSAPEQGIGALTLYAFSSDNWKRPQSETSYLMGLLRTYLSSELSTFVENNIRLNVIGRRDRLPVDLVRKIRDVEAATEGGERLVLRVALDYSAREAILAAATSLQHDNDLSLDSISRHLSGTGETCDVDLLIRTSGEQRLSDFLLWECAYAELYFTDCLWPDFTPRHLREALAAFCKRDRRFGGLKALQERYHDDQMSVLSKSCRAGNSVS